MDGLAFFGVNDKKHYFGPNCLHTNILVVVSVFDENSQFHLAGDDLGVANEMDMNRFRNIVA